MFKAGKKSIFIGILIVLVGIPLVIFASTIPEVRRTWVLATTVQPEKFTELYFEDHINLPTRAIKNQAYEFKFTIHNLEHERMVYPYEVSADYDGQIQVFDKKKVTLDHDEYKTITVYFELIDQVDKVRMTVRLVNKNQDIGFWLRAPGVEI